MKKDERKTKEQLINELDGMRQRVTELETSGSKHKQTAEALRVGEGHLSMLLDSVSDIIFIISVEPNDCYRFSMVNKRFLEVTGLSKTQVVGKLIQKVIPKSAHALVLGKYREAIRTRRTARWEEVSEYPAGKKTGEVTVAPVFDAKGNCIQLVGSVHDITESKLIEEELRQSNERYATFVEKGNDGLIVLQDGLVKFANSKAAEITGFSAEEVRGKPFIEFVAPQHRKLVMERYLKRLSGEEIPSKYEMGLLNKDGSVISVEVNASLIEYDGKPATLSMVRDITERKQLEEALRQSEENFRQLSETTFEGVAIHDKGKILLANLAFVKMFGYETSEVIGKNVLDLATPECRTLVKKNILRGYEEPYDAIGLRKDGSTFIGELRGSPMKLGGRWLRATAIRDITERKHMEDRLRETEQNFRNSLNDSPLGIRIITEDGELLYANKAILDIYGYGSVEELETIPTRKRYTPESYAEHQKRKELRRQGKPVPSNYEISIMRKDGETRHLAVSHNEVTWNGKTQFQAVYQDITERKKLQEQLMAQDRLASIGQLVSGVAHELNNPLTSVIGFSELLLQRELPDDIKADLKIVNGEAKRTASIVKNLLIFARRQPEGKAPFDINEQIQKVLDLRSHEHTISNIQVNTHFTAELPQIMGNVGQFQQVFFNLIVNAEQAMLEAHSRGTLAITTERAGNIVKARFTDDGPGISPENMKRLFTPFFTTKEIGKGTGLGLSICHGIITEHGGKIFAKSAPGKGATFIIELSLCKS